MPPRNRQHVKRSQKAKHLVQEDSQRGELTPEEKALKPWAPSPYTAFKALLSARLSAAVWSNISDCDEVFNYWEPAHFMLYGTGFQTWEYSPLYAIRSYSYILLHALPGFIYSTFLQSNKVLVFYFTRCLLGFISAACEVYFYRSVCHHFGTHVGRLMLVFLLFGSGMFISSTAFLPSTFSMYLTMVALGSWFMMEMEFAVLATAASTLLGWPFSAILSLPFAFDLLVLKKNVTLFVKWSLISLGLILIPVVLIDTHYFGKFVVAPLNIVLYNVFTSHGPDLYGTEPWSFYFFNGFLNFNFVFVAALFSLPAVAFCRYVLKEKSSRDPSHLLSLTPLYLWMIVFIMQPHKEERFLFPIYPLICLAASVTVDCAQKVIFRVSGQMRSSEYFESSNSFSLIFCVIFSVLCLSRTVMVYRGYHAPVETFMELSKLSQDDSLHPLPPELPVNVCIGKEWYRFPSSFFLPPNWQLQFLKSEFGGQLPKPYSDLPNATRIVPLAMNDQNLEEPSRYVNIKHCDYLVDSDFPSDSQFETKYSEDKNFEIISTISFLDAQRSPRLLRAFYIPYFSDYNCSYVDYHLMQNKKIKDRIAKKRRKPLSF